MHEPRSFGKVLSWALVKHALHLEQNKLRPLQRNVTVITKSLSSATIEICGGRNSRTNKSIVVKGDIIRRYDFSAN